jgi:hypothetical protein
MPLRDRLSLACEALIWILAMGWLLFLGWDAFALYRDHSLVPWRDLLEIALLALLVYWPILRVRIRYGYWMQSWDDVPGSSTAPVLRPLPPQPRSPAPR